MKKGWVARCSDSANKHQHHKNVDAFANMFAQQLERPKAYMITLQFREMNLDEDKNFMRVSKIVRLFMEQLTAVLVRDPKGSDSHIRPKGFAVLDRVSGKGRKREVTVIYAANGTLHVHILLVIHPRSLVTGLSGFFHDNHRAFLKNGITRLHVQRIRNDPRKVARYAMKSIHQRRYPSESIMMFPEAISEISHGPFALERSESDLGTDEVFLNRVLGRMKNLGDELAAKKVKASEFLSSTFMAAHQLDEKYGAKARSLVSLWLNRHKPAGASVPRKSGPTYALVLGTAFQATHKTRSKYKRKLDRVRKRVGSKVTRERLQSLLSRAGKRSGISSRLKPFAQVKLSKAVVPNYRNPISIDRQKVLPNSLKPIRTRPLSRSNWYEWSSRENN